MRQFGACLIQHSDMLALGVLRRSIQRTNLRKKESQRCWHVDNYRHSASLRAEIDKELHEREQEMSEPGGLTSLSPQCLAGVREDEHAKDEAKQPERLLIATDTPAGSGIMPLGRFYTISHLASLGGMSPDQAIAAATGNNARVYRLEAFSRSARMLISS
jgi:hypothetical protein